jgi:hypothetical protein
VLHVLAVDPGGPRGLDAPPSIELLWAHGPEDAVEKLARNRRVDAVLFFDDEVARATTDLLAAEGGTPPPLFRPGGSAIAGVEDLDAAALFEDLRTKLGE